MVDKMSFDEFVIKYKGTIDKMGLDFQPYVNKVYLLKLQTAKRIITNSPFSYFYEAPTHFSTFTTI